MRNFIALIYVFTRRRGDIIRSIHLLGVVLDSPSTLPSDLTLMLVDRAPPWHTLLAGPETITYGNYWSYLSLINSDVVGVLIISQVWHPSRRGLNGTSMHGSFKGDMLQRCVRYAHSYESDRFWWGLNHEIKLLHEVRTQDKI